MLTDSIEAVFIGASAGAIDALLAILPSLPATSKIAVIVVVHLPSRRPSLLVNLFASKCNVPVREPEDKEPIVPGVWFAPPDYHLLVERDRVFSLSIDPPVNLSRPSVDVLFESAADAFGDRAMCIVLTGGNGDGAEGARKIRDAGGAVVVQDPDTALAKEMPEAAVLRANPQVVAPLPEIAVLLRQVARAETP